METDVALHFLTIIFQNSILLNATIGPTDTLTKFDLNNLDKSVLFVSSLKEQYEEDQEQQEKPQFSQIHNSILTPNSIIFQPCIPFKTMNKPH